ncbi:hypothetical protein DL96DRAFT_346996 [Flagelloscypha sp. PMI_526]|nr:hypothetical protein DL96DRAFT_346996 [Flagelloscypha sp. PMI_526]
MNSEVHVETNAGDESPISPLANVQGDDGDHRHKRHPARLFGLPPYQPVGTGQRNFDYDAKYPNEEQPGEEASENARVWMIYNDEAEIFDDDMLNGFRDTLDSLLVFAALFSAVVTTLLVQTSTKLEPDHAQIATYLLAEQILLLRANGNMTAINSIAPSFLNPNAVTWSSADVAVNVPFPVSLSLSLSTALFSILVKQWLTAYAAKVPGTPKQVALTRHFRFCGFQKWKLPQFIGILPLVLHSSLWVFAAGLLLFVLQLNLTVFCVAASVLGATFGLYFVSLIAPPFFDDCPYNIPFLDTPVRFFGSVFWDFATYIFHYGKYLTGRTVRHFFPQTKLLRGYHYHRRPHFDQHIWHLRTHFEGIHSRHPSNLCKAIAWLIDYSTNPTIRQAAAKSLAGILPLEAGNFPHHWFYDLQIAKTLAGNHFILDVIWDQLSTISLPKSSAQLQSMLNPSSPAYNPWVRAECALHSWSYYWVEREMLPESPLWVTHRGRWAVSAHGRLKESHKELFAYVVHCEDVWDPRTQMWMAHPIDWDQRYSGESLLGMIGSFGLADLPELIWSKVEIDDSVAEDDELSITPVASAATAGHLKTVKAFVAAGADLKRGQSPLYFACRWGHTEVVEFLLEQPDILDRTGKEDKAEKSPFFGPIENGDADLVQLLLDKGAQVSLEHRRELMEKAKQVNVMETVHVLEQAWASESSNGQGLQIVVKLTPGDPTTSL